jgi:hypothetical protein
MKQLIWLAVICLAMPLAVRAQSATTDPVSSHLREIFDAQSKNIIAAAEEFPADKYTYHPTPEGRTVGNTVGHIAQVNNFACAQLGGVDAPPRVNIPETDKDKLVAALKASMDFCRQQFATLTDAKMGDPLKWRNMTRFGVADEVTYDLYDHYATLSVYLRLNGLLPPTAQKTP